jgi:hypothetical protein
VSEIDQDLPAPFDWVEHARVKFEYLKERVEGLNKGTLELRKTSRPEGGAIYHARKPGGRGTLVAFFDDEVQMVNRLSEIEAVIDFMM